MVKRAIQCLYSTIGLSAFVKVVRHVKAIWARGLICLTIVAVLQDFAVKVGHRVLDLAHPCCHILAIFITHSNAVLASVGPHRSA